jgi:hypothetical protein
VECSCRHCQAFCGIPHQRASLVPDADAHQHSRTGPLQSRGFRVQDQPCIGTLARSYAGLELRDHMEYFAIRLLCEMNTDLIMTGFLGQAERPLSHHGPC